MASESTSSQQSSHLSPSSKVNFKCEEGIIAYNNVVALLEHPNFLYHPMLSFLSNCYIKVDDATKTITFSLLSVEKPLSFNQEKFISTTSLPVCENAIPTPPKEIVRAGLATLGLFDKEKPSLSSSVLSYLGLEIDIGGIIFSDLIHKLQNGKNNREANIRYTRYLSLIFEELLGENYINDDLTFVKPYTISAASFQTPLASESLILSSEKVNADDSTDKSLSTTTMQPVTQPKAPTDLKLWMKKILPLSKPKASYQVTVILPKK
ncbi:hypothetical protein Tco_1290303 [Tanacetum coccineum]